MKRILAVLALLTLCGMAFSVSGKVFTRMSGAGGVYNKCADWFFDGPYKQTGFDLNFDGFGFSYKLMAVDPDNSLYWDAAKTAAGAGIASIAPNSPGYFEINGLNLGPIQNFAIGAGWWVSERSASAFQTNALGVTNADGTASYSYNRVVIETYFAVPVSDMISVSVDGWDRAYFLIKSAAGDRKMAGTAVATNSYTASSFLAHVPAYITYSQDALSLTLKPVVEIGNSATMSKVIGQTNETTGTSSTIAAIARIHYKISDNLLFYAHPGIAVINTTSVSKKSGGTVETNETVASTMEAPLVAGLGVTLAPGIVFNLGIGYKAVLSSSSKATTMTSTNETKAGGGLGYTYGNGLSENVYGGKPFLNVGGSAKMGEGWEVGWAWVNWLDGADWGANNDVYSDSTDKWGFTKQSSTLVFTPEINYDENVYIAYTKDNVTLTGIFGDNTGVFGAFAGFSITYNGRTTGR
jgi:hypothetical protein